MESFRGAANRVDLNKMSDSKKILCRAEHSADKENLIKQISLQVVFKFPPGFSTQHATIEFLLRQTTKTLPEAFSCRLSIYCLRFSMTSSSVVRPCLKINLQLPPQSSGMVGSD